MKTKSALSVVAVTLAGLASVGPPKLSADEASLQEFFGTGSREASVTSVVETLGNCGDDDPATNIVLATRQGTVTYTGIIEGTGTVFTKSIVDGCVPAGVPRPGSAKVRDTFERVTIAGRTGGAVIETDSFIDQFFDPIAGRVIANPATGTRRILCGTGELENVHGEGVIAGNSTATSAGGTYAMWVHFDRVRRLFRHGAGFDFLCEGLDGGGDSVD